MKKTALVFSVLLFSAAAVDARGRGAGGRSSGRGFSSRGGFSRPLSRPTFAHSNGAGIVSRTASASRAKGRSSFANASRLTGTGAPGGAGGSTPSASNTPPAYAAPGAKILSAGQQPVYSNPGNGGTHSVQGGGFIAIDQGHAGDVGRGPGVTWGSPDRAASAGAGAGGGSGASANGPAFDPSF